MPKRGSSISPHLVADGVLLGVSVLFAWWWLGGKMGLWGSIGAGLILGGILAAELANSKKSSVVSVKCQVK